MSIPATLNALNTTFSCNFIIERQKYLRGHPGQASRTSSDMRTTLWKNVLEYWKWAQTSNVCSCMCVRKRMGENRMDGRMEVTETQSDQMKDIKRQRTYGKHRSVSSFVFSVSFST